MILLARAGRRVLAVDTDPQFALSRQLGITVGELPLTLVAGDLGGEAGLDAHQVARAGG